MKFGLPLFVVALLLFVSPPARAGGSVRAEGQRVIVSLSAPPITRVRVSFDQESGRHLEVSFDPAKSDGLIRNLYLGATKTDKWNVSVSADPIVLASGSTTHFLSLLFTTKSGTAAPYDPTSSVELAGAFSDAFAEKMQPLQTYTVKVAPAAAAGTPLRATATPALPVAGARSADVSGIAEELVRIVAEIAVDRARSRGLALLTSQIKKAVCNDLAWTPDFARALQRRAMVRGGQEDHVLQPARPGHALRLGVGEGTADHQTAHAVADQAERFDGMGPALLQLFQLEREFAPVF